MKEIGDNKKIAKNTMYLYLRMFFAIIVSLYTSRVVLNALGVVDFGIFSVVAGFISFLSFLTTSLSSSIQRYYNYEEQIEGTIGFIRIYKVSVLIHVAMAVLVFIFFETFGLWYINNVLVIPTERLFAANIVFQTAIVSVVCTILQTPYSGAILAKEHINFYALVGIFDVVFRLIGVILLTYASYDKLILYAFLSLFITIVNSCLYIAYAKNKFLKNNNHIKLDVRLIRPVLTFSAFNAIGSFSMMLKSQGISLLLNFFFGPVINAARSIAYQVNTAISGFCYNIAFAVRPQLVNAYASGNYDRTRMLLFAESKLCFTLIAALITPVIIEIHYILHFWLGTSVPNYTDSFVILILLDMLVNTLNVPVSQVAHAVGNIKRYQVASTIVNLGLLPVSWILLMLDYSPSAVYIIMIVFSCINQMVCVVYANRLFSFGISIYIQKVIFPCFALICLLPIVPFLLSKSLSPSFLRLLLIGFTSVLISVFLYYVIVMSNGEKIFIKQLVMSKLNLRTKQSKNNVE